MIQTHRLPERLTSWADDFAQRGASFGIGLDIVALLLALRIDHERTLPPFELPSVAPDGHGWTALLGKAGVELTSALSLVLEGLSSSDTLLGFLSRVPAIPDEPAHLAALIAEINDPESAIGTPWTGALNVLAEAFDDVLVEAGNDASISLLPTHRSLTKAMAHALQPGADETIHDPAAGSGGLLLAARTIAGSSTTNRVHLERLRDDAFAARELRPDLARWCAFNLWLHGIGRLGDPPLVRTGDSLAAPEPAVASVVLTNPEFGRQEAGLAATVTAGSRGDINVTGNRQMDMLQHVMSMLAPGGRAAVVMPDNVLFEAGAGETVRKRLLDTCALHTILRLPKGISRKGSVKANVLFFDKMPAREQPWTTETWFYDLRTNKNFTLKKNRMTDADLQPFIDAYCVGEPSERTESERFRRYTYDELVGGDYVSLDITWLRDDSHVDAADLPAPAVLARELADDALEAADLLDQLAEDLEESLDDVAS